MKQGIYLGRPPARSNLLLLVMLVAAGAGALVLAVLYQRARTEVEELENEVASLSRAFSGPEGAESPLSPSPDRTRFVAARLRLALDSGAPGTVAPTALLRLVESALPEGVLLERLSFNASPQQSLTLEAVALGGDRVTELQRRLSSSSSVSMTRVLEERRLPDGRLAVRIQVGLEQP
jgi:Tfp pilus assembly protein PilN